MKTLRPRPGRLLASLAVVAGASLSAVAPAAAKPEPATAPSPEIVERIPELPFKGKVQPKGSYVGAAGPGGRFFVALVVRGDDLAVYLCDGKEVSDWFGGRVRGGRFDVLSADGTRLRGTVGKVIRGRLTVRGAGRHRLTAVRARKGWGLYAGRDTRLGGDYKYRWIRIGNSVRGLSDDGTESTKNGAAITEPGFVTPESTSTGSGSGTGSGSSALSDLTCSELQEEANRLRAEAAELEKKKKTKWVKSSLTLMYNTIINLMIEGAGRQPRCEV